MEKYKIEFKRPASKEIRALPLKEIKKILAKINALAENPRPPDSIKLSGEDKYRVRCGDCRILYKLEDKVMTVYVVKVGHRKDAYR